jgi:outer membrane protein assembly factor BamB
MLGALVVAGPLVAAGLVPAGPAAAAAVQCQVQYQAQSDWGSGFTAGVTITNLGPALNGWTLAYSYSGNQHLSQGWSGTWSQSGQAVTVTNAGWNASLPTGASTNIGANFSYSGTNAAPTSFSINGTTCNGATPPPSQPQVALTSPSDNAQFTAGASVALSASASESGGTISSVAFYNGSALLGSDTSSPYSYDWTNVPAGTYALTATATDTSGATATSDPVTITVQSGQTGAGDWTTYHRDGARDGYAPDLAPLSTLSVAWNASLDGAVYGQPLVVGGRLFAATEHDTVYALDPATGAVLWSRHVGEPEPLADLPCGTIDPLGITSTMVYDPATNRLFTLAETTGGAHTLFGINADTGAVEVQTEVEPPQGDRIAHQQRGALTLMGGRVYIPYGGLYGDCANYIGSVVSVTTGGQDPHSYAVPTTREGGIWAPPGGVVDGDHLLYAVGNGESRTDYDGSDAVIALSSGLARLDFFAPSTWATENAGDEDLGSASPTLVGQYVFADGKDGIGYVLRNDALGGIGGEVAQLPVCVSFGGTAVVGNTVYVPCTTGTRAVSIGTDGTPQVLWHSSAAGEGSPVVGGGAVWVVDYDGGNLFALDPATGAVDAQIHLGALPHFASATLSGDHAYIGTLNGVVAVGGA